MTEEVKVVEPSEQWIVEKKKKHGKLFKVVLSGQLYIYRYLTRSEFKAIQKEIFPQIPAQGQPLSPDVQASLEERVTKLCTLWPENIEKEEDLPANVPTILSQYISDASGYIEEPPTEI